jgi:uncharacterized surface protein with fasciclin (FAS1) repeats
MTSPRILRLAVLPLLLGFAAVGCGDDDSILAPEPQPLPDIVDTAVGAGIFETLVAAVTAADLAETLKSPGPFTVFAPTDDAFAALPEGTVESLILPENKDQLVAVLTYHVVPGALFASDVLAQNALTTVQGSVVTVDADNVRINESNIIQADIEASNGVIHVIDAVLLPPAE